MNVEVQVSPRLVIFSPLYRLLLLIPTPLLNAPQLDQLLIVLDGSSIPIYSIIMNISKTGHIGSSYQL